MDVDWSVGKKVVIGGWKRRRLERSGVVMLVDKMRCGSR